MSRRRKKDLPLESEPVYIEKFSHDGRGIAHVAGKTVFILGALPGETVTFRYLACQRRFDEGSVVQVIQAVPERVTPGCPHFGVCGGCNLQHLAPAAQIALKQNVLLEQLHHVGQVSPAKIAPPLLGPLWGYRRKARLGVKYVLKKQVLMIGFREQRSHLVADLQQCDILHPRVGTQLSTWRQCIAQLEVRDKIAQIEVAVDDTQAALILRHLVPLSAADQQILRTYAQTTKTIIYLQPAGPDSVTPLWPQDLPLASLVYSLPDTALNLQFAPQDFTQINHEINQQMIPQALTWLAPQPHETVLELFCGLGNFTLPLAQQVSQVVAVEGDAGLLKRAEINAHRHHLSHISYHAADLADTQLTASWLQGAYDKILLDPPRSGALAILQALPFTQTQKIVYVSCNPATLARDAGELVHQKGFRLTQVGVMDMFPHTAHVESMALFER